MAGSSTHLLVRLLLLPLGLLHHLRLVAVIRAQVQDQIALWAVAAVLKARLIRLLVQHLILAKHSTAHACGHMT